MNEVMRTRSWLQTDQRAHWENQVKIKRRELEQAQAELFSARISKLEQASAAQQMAVQRSQRAIHDAEDKLRLLKKMGRELENRSEPLLKLVEQLHGFLSTDMVRATAFLTEMIKTLQPTPKSEFNLRLRRLRFRPPPGAKILILPSSHESQRQQKQAGGPSAKSFRFAGNETKQYWKDGKSHEFDQRYMTELLARVDKNRYGDRKIGRTVEQG